MAKRNGTITRRRLLRGAVVGAAGVGAFHVVPRHVLGGPGRLAPSDTITRAVIGVGYRGCVAHVKPNEPGKPPTTLAVCDVDAGHLAGALRKAGPPCKGYSDFRRVLERKDIDAVYIATPPHWHALICVAAAQAGKDIFCEKPMTHHIAEGRKVVQAVARYGCVFQIGTFGRFRASKDRRMCEVRRIMDSGMLPRQAAPVVLWASQWNVRLWCGRKRLSPQPVPSELDYDFWLGPAPYKPYHWHRVHNPNPGVLGMSSFRAYWDYDGGGLTDMGEHHLDSIQWTLGKDRTSPVEVEAYAPWPADPEAVGPWGHVIFTYADGTKIVIDSREWGEPWKGSARWPSAADLPAQCRAALAAVNEPPTPLDFDSAVRTRQPAGGDAESSHRNATLLHLGNIAIRTGRRIRYDPATERIIGDETAAALVNPPMRTPWVL
jgi:predicted dehydrogenase